MTRVDLDYVEDFEFVSDEELAVLIQEAQAVPEIQLTDDDLVFGEEDLQLPLFDYTEEQWQEELDRAFEQAFTPSERIERGVAFCENVRCDDYLKGSFLMMHEGKWRCSNCDQYSDHLVPEKGIPEREGQVPFAAVRVEYCYESASKRYTEIVQLSDESYQGPSGVYTLQSPLVKTPKRAAKMAESLLAILNEGVHLDDDLSSAVPRSQERILSFDKPADEFRKDLEALEHRLRDNSLLQQPSVVSTSSVVELNMEEGDPGGPQQDHVGRTTDREPRVLPGRNQGAGSLSVHDRRQPGGVRSERTTSRLHPVQPVGTRVQGVRRAASQGRRGGSDRKAPGKLRTAAGRYLSSLVRGKGRGNSSRT